MRKQTKLVAVLSAAALLAIGASMTSFAASGWQEENGTWVYLDRDGDYVTDAWKKSGNNYFYLDEDGYMATEKVIDFDGETYYVDANGAKVVNQWVAVPNDDDQWDEEVDTIWYFFGSTGKAYKSDKKTINGKMYIFDDEAHMLSGWQTYEDELYYLGTENEGWAYTGWQYLEPEDDNTDAYDDEEWFYFKPSNGKAYKSSRKYINGHYYTFDENGIMLDKWVVGTPGAPDYTDKTGTDSSARYQAEIGNLETGWVYTYAPSDEDENDDEHWYYLDSKGVPFNEVAKDSKGIAKATKKDGDTWKDPVTKVAAKVIKSKTYLFDATGQMQTGVFKLEDVYRTGSSSKLGVGENGVPEAKYYYFNKNGGSTEGQMMTGKQTVTYDGDNYYYYFQKDGSAYTDMIVDGTLYGTNGQRINADDGNTYMLVSTGSENVGDSIKIKGQSKAISGTLVVNASGKAKKSGTVKIDGYKYTIENYTVKGEPVAVD